MFNLLVADIVISFTVFIAAARIPFLSRVIKRPRVRPPDVARPAASPSRSQSFLAAQNSFSGDHSPQAPLSQSPHEPNLRSTEIMPIEVSITEAGAYSGTVSNNFQFQEFMTTLDPQHRSGVTVDFLAWLVGFIEGDGSWGRTTRGDWFFVITQKRRKALDIIQEKLGFGTIYHKSNGTFEYTVRSKELFRRMLLLLNGNLILEKRRTRFTEIVQLWNRHVPMHPVHQKPWSAEIELDNGWISGFFDAEATFIVSNLPPPAYLSIKLEVTQSEPKALEKIHELFQVNGKLLIDSRRQVFKAAIRSIENQKILIEYLTRFPMIVKSSEFRWWKLLYNLKAKKPLTDRLKRVRDKVIRKFKLAKKAEN